MVRVHPIQDISHVHSSPRGRRAPLSNQQYDDSLG